jgi:hypothetical protein
VTHATACPPAGSGRSKLFSNLDTEIEAFLRQEIREKCKQERTRENDETSWRAILLEEAAFYLFIFHLIKKEGTGREKIFFTHSLHAYKISNTRKINNCA